MLCCTACGILVPQPEIEPMPPALTAQNFNHWTTREVPLVCVFYFYKDLFVTFCTVFL